MRLACISFCVMLFFVACQGSDHKTAVTAGLKTKDSAAANAPLTNIEWIDSADKNFGKVAEGKQVEVAFRFRNSGDAPLIIERVQPSCGCTVAEQPAEPIAPGKEGVIKASFNSEGRIGQNHKTLYVYANTRMTKSHELHFVVEVEKKKW